MKRIYLKRIISVSLATVMTLNLAACGCGNKKTTVADEEVSHDATAYVYKENPISLGEGVDVSNITALGSFGEKLYAIANAYSDDGSYTTNLYTFDKEGNDVQSIELKVEENFNITNSAVGTDGSIYTIETKYGGMSFGGDDMSIGDFIGAGDGSFEIVPESDGDTSASSATEDNSSEEAVTESIDQYSADDEDVEEADTDDEGTDSDAATSDDSDSSDDTTDSTSDTTSDATLETTESGTTESTSDDNNVILPSDDSSNGGGTNDPDIFNLVKRDASGAEVWKKQLDTTVDTYFYINSFMLADDSTLLVSDTTGIHKYNTEDGTKASDINIDAVADSEYGLSLNIYKKGNGDLIVISTGSAPTYYAVDLSADTLTSIEGSDNPFYDYTFYSGAGDHDLLAVGTEGVYTYNIGDDNVSMIMNFVDSDINTYGLSQMAALSETDIVALIPSDDMGFTLSFLKKVDPKAVGERQQITLGCNYIDYDVRSQIIKFNKKNDNYRIVINDYSKYDSDSDVSAGSGRLNTDIVSGNAPDILVLDSDMPVDSYISKGLFEDMNEYFEKDEELSKNKYMDHVMDAFKTDGKMYKLIPSYYIETVVASKKDAGDDFTWTIDELEKIVKEKNIQYKNIFGALSRDEVFEMALSLSGSQYIDWSTLTCSYDSDAFIHLLEFINEFPEELEEDDYYNDTSAYWRQGLSIADRLYLYQITDYNYEAKGQFGEDIITCGFPSDNGSGSALYPNLQLTMNSSSKVKDGCWEFMRYFLTDEYQKNIEGALPVNMSRMDEMIANAKKKPTYIDENGKEVEYDDTWYIGETEVVISPMTDDEINEVLDFINSIDQVGNANEEVANIIYEEAAAYFSGQKTAKEVADIIQSRVQIYVNEIS